MTGQGTICKISKLEKIENADFLLQSRTLGETLIVSKDIKEGDLGILFDCETQINEEYLKINCLYRHSEKNIDTTKIGMMEDSGRVRPIKLRGVRVSGFWMPIESLLYTGGIHTLREGDKINEVNGHLICKKYVPTKTRERGNSNQQPKIRENLIPTLKFHYDTDNLLKSIGDLKEGRFVLTRKLHGCALLVANLPVERKLTWYEKLLSKFVTIPKFEYKEIVGSRRVLKSIEGEEREGTQHYYESNVWDKAYDLYLKHKLPKGITLYLELTGWVNETTPIMPRVQTNTLKPFMDKSEFKQLVNRYGDEIVYTYGSREGECDVWLHRATYTNEDGEIFELSFEQICLLAEKLDIKTVPFLVDGFVVGRGRDRELRFNESTQVLLGAEVEIKDWEDLVNRLAENYIVGEENEPNHIPEGIVLRQDGMQSKAYKLKSYLFKCGEGLVKDRGEITLDEEV